VAALGEGAQVAPGAAAEVEDRVGTGSVEGVEQRIHVLRDVVIAGAGPEVVRRALVVVEGLAGDGVELVGAEARHGFKDAPASSRVKVRLPRRTGLL